MAAISWLLGVGQPGREGSDNGAAASDASTYAGLPRAQASDELLLLRNTGFVIGYSEQRRAPLWVAYKAGAVGQGRLPPRPEFERDARSRAAVTRNDLAGRGYDRGHMAPNYAIARLYGRKAQQQTFLMTNVVAQKSRLNQLLWQRIEEVEVDHIAPRLGELWVITGPVFDARRETLRSGVEIADAFYRLWLDVTADGRPRALAFLVPQNVRGDEPLTQFLTTVDRIEALTGLDFYAELPVAQQALLESRRANPAAWGLDAVACQPARYGDDWQGRQGIHLRYDRCQ